MPGSPPLPPPYAPKPAAGQDAAWLLTFTDLVGLMLAFFVMLFAMTSIDAGRWHQLTGSLAGGDGPATGSQPRPADRNIAAAGAEEGRDLGYLAILLSRKLTAEPALAGATVRRLGDRVAIGLPVAARQDTVPTGISPDALFALGGILRGLPNALAVEVHAAKAIQGDRWAAGLRQALAIAAALGDAGGQAVAARAYADLAAGSRWAAGRIDIAVYDAEQMP